MRVLRIIEAKSASALQSTSIEPPLTQPFPTNWQPCGGATGFSVNNRKWHLTEVKAPPGIEPVFLRL